MSKLTISERLQALLSAVLLMVVTVSLILYMSAMLIVAVAQVLLRGGK